MYPFIGDWFFLNGFHVPFHAVADLSSLSTFITSVWNSAPSRLLVSISFSVFLESCLSFHLGRFLVSSFRQPPRVCVCVLDGAATPPGHGRVALCSRCPVGSSGALLPHCGHPPVAIEP